MKGRRVLHRTACAGVLLLAVGGCANPVNRETSDRYGDQCAAAERGRELGVAEQACYRAVVNVDAGNLGPELRSERLYDLARIKRQQARFGEAEGLLRESLRIELGLSGENSLKVARRRVELAVDLAGQDRWSDGGEVLALVVAYGPGFSGQELAYAKATYREFANWFRALGQPDRAMIFEAAGTGP